MDSYSINDAKFWHHLPHGDGSRGRCLLSIDSGLISLLNPRSYGIDGTSQLRCLVQS